LNWKRADVLFILIRLNLFFAHHVQWMDGWMDGWIHAVKGLESPIGQMIM
jgi:hypothetical protein